MIPHDSTGKDELSYELSNTELLQWLRERMARRAPAAVVRFNVGEGRLLAAGSDGDESAQDAIRKLERETGQPFSSEAMFEVKASVSRAFDEADVLGIALDGNMTDQQKVWQEKITTLYLGRQANGRAPAKLAHPYFNHRVLDSLPEVLAGHQVSVISCRDLEAILEGEWRLGDVAVYKVPSEHAVRDVDGSYEAALHDTPIWPDVNARLLSELTVREPGEVFLVGAGVFGKDLCIRIRDRGGIALDMGSALDHIAGKITRGPTRRVRSLRERGMPLDEIRAWLGRFYGVPAGCERIDQAIREASLGDDVTRR